MLHPTVLQEMLDDEIAAAAERLGVRLPTTTRNGSRVTVELEPNLRLELDGRRYDSEPFRVQVTDAQGVPVSHEAWPPGLSLGQHPVLNRPFACVQGTYEYHAHPSHLTDHWALYRNQLRLSDLLDHLLRKAGR